MTLLGAAALFGAMAVLAAVPGVSVLAVTARAAAHGFAHGAFTALGIVVADLLFILLAVFGLVLLARALGDGFIFIRYAGGIYLMVLGAVLWRTQSRPAHAAGAAAPTLLSSFMAGLLITLGDQKALLFYLGFLPAFVDLAALSGADIGAIAAITVVAVGGVKLAYAHAAARAAQRAGAQAGRLLNRAAAAVMIAAGAYVVATG